MRHDPERNAAAYLGGVLRGRRKSAFEAHFVECEDCWQEVQTGRRGRAVAESGRELAPQVLRERLRASVAARATELSGDSPRLTTSVWNTLRPGVRRWPVPPSAWVAAIVIIALGALAVSVVYSQDDTSSVETVVTGWITETSNRPIVEARLPKRLGDLSLESARTKVAGSLDVTVHGYEDEAGHVVVVYQADETFPVARGAHYSSNGTTWSAEMNGASLFCADRPIPSLVIGDDRSEVMLAADELGLR